MKEIKLTQGKFALIDDEDFERVNKFKWYAHKVSNTFYARRCITINGKCKTQLMHKLIMGDNPQKLDIDHITGDGCNNQKVNLRFCTRSENMMNQRSQVGVSSKYKGVCWFRASKKWRAYIKKEGICIHLGLFASEIEASQSYNVASIKYFGEFAHQNVMP